MKEIKINPELNFWDVYPELKLIEEFKYIQKEFKSKSSMVMWFIASCFYIKSIFRRVEFNLRTEILSKDYMQDADWYKKNGDKIQDAARKFEEITDSQIEKHLRQWEETLAKRTKFLRECEYDLENFAKLDAMAVGTEKLLQTFDKIQAALKREAGEGVTKGGHIPSLSDEEEI